MKIGDMEYQKVNPAALTATNILVKRWKELGKPKSPFSTSGTKLMDTIIAIWEDLYPIDRETWYAQRTEYKNAELSIHDQVVGQTGRSLASYPYPIFQMIVKVFKGFDPAERKNCIKMVKKWPMFQFVNKV